MSGKQQLSISIRWVDTKFEVHEDFIGVYEMDGADAATIEKMITDALLRLGLPLNQLRGQGYDGASVMSGNISGVSTRIMALKKRAVYIHCCAHSLNLALQDATRSCTVVRDILDFVREVVNFVRASPNRSRVFARLRSEFSEVSLSHTPTTGLRPLCPTRWSVRSKAIRSIVDNYEALRDTFEEISQTNTDESGSKASGFLRRMNTFEVFFILQIALRVFEPSEICSKKLQKVNFSVTEAIQSAVEVAEVIEKTRTEESFNLLYDECVQQCINLDLDPPTLPRLKKQPKRLNDGAQPHNFADPRSRCRQQYFEILDTTATAIRSRFEQKGFKVCHQIEKVLMMALNPCGIKGDEFDGVPDGDAKRRESMKNGLHEICDHFDGDLDYERLLRQLDVLRDTIRGKHINTVRDVCSCLAASSSLHDVFDEVSKLLRLFLVIPATSATAERSFSAMRRLKTYLRSTMTAERLNSVMLLHVHKDKLDGIDNYETMSSFVSCNDRRRDLFGT
jgi:Domain of unknown function (DUF4371)/hAT family C-terminal dimerisation region